MLAMARETVERTIFNFTLGSMWLTVLPNGFVVYIGKCGDGAGWDQRLLPMKSKML